MKSLPCFIIIFFLSCTASQSYFKSPDNVFKEKVILHLHNNVDIPGILSVTFEDDFNRYIPDAKTLKFIQEGKTSEENININDVIGYSFNKNYYALKKLFLFTDNKNHLLFAKRLTAEDSRIQLYEFYETGRGNATNEEQYSYFISLPAFGQYETLNTKSEKLVPNFDQKMSVLVEDCPTLAEKIRNKKSDYFLPLVSFNSFKHREVMTKIIDEYNHCR